MTDGSASQEPLFSEEQAQYLQSLVAKLLATALAEEREKGKAVERLTAVGSQVSDWLI